MRHQDNKLLQLNTGNQKKSVFIRTLLSNLIRTGAVTTTPKRAKVLKAEADSFFSRLVRIDSKYEEKDARRECINIVKATIYWEVEGKKVMETLLPKYREMKWKSFVANYKIWFRKWDGSEKILIKLI